MAPRKVRKCDYCISKFGSYPAKVATLIYDGKRCCAECKRKLDHRKELAR